MDSYAAAIHRRGRERGLEKSERNSVCCPGIPFISWINWNNTVRTNFKEVAVEVKVGRFL